MLNRLTWLVGLISVLLNIEIASAGNTTVDCESASGSVRLLAVTPEMWLEANKVEIRSTQKTTTFNRGTVVFGIDDGVYTVAANSIHGWVTLWSIPTSNKILENGLTGTRAKFDALMVGTDPNGNGYQVMAPTRMTCTLHYQL